MLIYTIYSIIIYYLKLLSIIQTYYLFKSIIYVKI